jgi:hypothetical protein
LIPTAAPCHCLKTPPPLKNFAGQLSFIDALAEAERSLLMAINTSSKRLSPQPLILER